MFTAKGIKRAHLLIKNKRCGFLKYLQTGRTEVIGYGRIGGLQYSIRPWYHFALGNLFLSKQDSPTVVYKHCINKNYIIVAVTM